MNTILITGASGRIARRTAELAAAEQHSLRLMTRTPQRAPRLRGASVVHGDFTEPATLDAAFAGVDIALVVSASGKPTERAQLHRHAFPRYPQLSSCSFSPPDRLSTKQRVKTTEREYVHREQNRPLVGCDVEHGRTRLTILASGSGFS